MSSIRYGTNQRGFSIVEVLISLLLVSIAFFGVFSTYTTSLKIQAEIDDRSKAMFLAQKHMEEALTIPYEELEVGYTMDYYESELRYPLLLVSTVSDVADADIHAQWTRFTDPDEDAAYKKIEIQAEWGPTDGTYESWESLNLAIYRVQRENTVEYHENASSLLPQNE